MKKILILLLAITLILSGTGCRNIKKENAELPSVQSRKIIIDTDTGADDAAAIIMAALQPEIEILGVTVVSGNVTLEQGAKNALMSLEVAGRTDVPVYCGSTQSTTGREYEIFSVFGKDGMGDADLIHPSNQPEEKNAVEFILETIEASPNEVELIALGPATNIALAIEKDPETMSKAKHIWVMGTAGFGPGNATPAAEFNVFQDPNAFRILADSKLPMTVVGLDTNHECTYITRNDQQKLMKGNELEQFLGAALNGLMEFNLNSMGQDVANLPDPIAMACMLWEGYMTETVPCHASVMTEQGETYGQVLFYQEGYEYAVSCPSDCYNVAVASQTQSEFFKTWFLQTLK